MFLKIFMAVLLFIRMAGVIYYHIKDDYNKANYELSWAILHLVCLAWVDIMEVING